MAVRPIVAQLVLVAFLVAAAFSLPITAIMPAGHDHTAGCPLVRGESAICDASLLHVVHWQSAFAAVVAEIFLFFTLASFFLFHTDVIPIAARYQRYRFRERYSTHPTLLQELFSRGVLNRKEP